LRKRSRARELALHALYQLDLRGPEVIEELSHYIDENAGEPGVRVFALELFNGCRERRDELDAHIQRVAENWDIRRMAVVDRNVLRLASYELLFTNDVPPKVAINEAIDLAKRYSTADSGAFVNGILDRIHLDHRSSETQEPSP
jgi:transcription antitermination factor NusB